MRKILIVDDSKSARYALRCILKKHECEFYSAESANVAFQMVDENPPDAIFMDIFMPDINGLDALDTLKSNPQTAHIPVVMCSVDEPKYRVQSVEKGALAFLPKPPLQEQINIVLGMIDYIIATRSVQNSDIAQNTNAVAHAPSDGLNDIDFLGLSEPNQDMSMPEKAVAELSPEDFEILVDADPEIKEAFVEDTSDLLKILHDDIGVWINNTSDFDLPGKIKKNIHTINGSDRICNITSISNTSYNLENFLAAIVGNKLQVNEKLLSLVQRTVDHITQQVEAVRNNAPVPRFQELINELNQATTSVEQREPMQELNQAGESAGQLAESDVKKINVSSLPDNSGLVARLEEISQNKLTGDGKIWDAKYASSLVENLAAGRLAGTVSYLDRDRFQSRANRSTYQSLLQEILAYSNAEHTVQESLYAYYVAEDVNRSDKVYAENEVITETSQIIRGAARVLYALKHGSLYTAEDIINRVQWENTRRIMLAGMYGVCIKEGDSMRVQMVIDQLK